MKRAILMNLCVIILMPIHRACTNRYERWHGLVRNFLFVLCSFILISTLISCTKIGLPSKSSQEEEFPKIDFGSFNSQYGIYQEYLGGDTSKAHSFVKTPNSLYHINASKQLVCVDSDNKVSFLRYNTVFLCGVTSKWLVLAVSNSDNPKQSSDIVLYSLDSSEEIKIVSGVWSTAYFCFENSTLYYATNTMPSKIIAFDLKNGVKTELFEDEKLGKDTYQNPNYFTDITFRENEGKIQMVLSYPDHVLGNLVRLVEVSKENKIISDTKGTHYEKDLDFKIFGVKDNEYFRLESQKNVYNISKDSGSKELIMSTDENIIDIVMYKTKMYYIEKTSTQKNLYSFEISTVKKKLLKNSTALYSLVSIGEKLYGYAGYGNNVELYQLDAEGKPLKTVWKKDGLSFNTTKAELKSLVIGKYLILMLDDTLLLIFDTVSGAPVR